VFSLFSICYKTQAKACGYQNWSFAIGSIFYVFIVRLSFGLLLSLQFICLSYWTDSLLGIKTRNDLERHPKIGASWEGFVIEQVIRWTGFRKEECFFWATHAGAELGLLVVKGRDRLGFEVKLTSSPRVTPSMRSALSDLKLQRLYVIHSGEETFQLERNIWAIALPRLLEDLKI